MSRDDRGRPIPIDLTAFGIAFAVAAGVGGVWLTVEPVDAFSPSDAVVPVLIGIVVGLVVAAVAFYIFFVKKVSSSRAPSPPNSVGLPSCRLPPH
jgi:uncharacterized membrane-anchored protein